MVQITKTSSRLKSLFSINKMMIVAVLAAFSVYSCVTDDENDSPTPQASFDVATDGSFATFTNTSVDALTSAWSFGDGSESNELSPIHRYAESGDYEVLLLTVNDGNTDVASQTITIEVPEVPEAAFTYEAVDREITFTNATNGAAVSYTWDFGDGIGTSSEESPVYTYAEDGTYTVSLTTANVEGVSSTSIEEIEVLEIVPVAGFTVETSGLDATFTNTSVDAETYSWDFGDDSEVSTEENPTYTYAAAGTYNVVLTATRENGNESTSTMEVVIEQIIATADFTFAPTDLQVVFTDASEANDANITAYAWDFGDESSISTDQNPTYTYGAGGDYEVTLTITFDDIDGVTTATSTQTVSVFVGASTVLGAVIRDTDSGDTGELRYNIDPLLSGRLEVTFTRSLLIQDVNSGSDKDAFIALLNSTGSTSSERSILDLRIKDDEFTVRDQDFEVTSVVPTPGTLQTAVVTWTAPDALTPPTVSVTIDGNAIAAPYQSGENSFGGVERVQFRFADNGAVLSNDMTYTIESFEVFTDVDGATSLFATDFSEFAAGEALDGDNDPFNNNSSEAVVEIIN